jgi:hypothetical protein
MIEQKFKTKRDWILDGTKGLGFDQDIIDGLVSIAVTKNGIHSIRKSQPSPTKQTRQYLTWKAFKIARHARVWGNLASWNEGLTFNLMMCSEADRDYFNRAFDAFSGVKK